MKTWELFARFSDRQPPAWPWDQPKQSPGTGIMMGGDVWGIAVEDVREWVKTVSSGRLLERLARDLRVSFDYARRSYL